MYLILLAFVSVFAQDDQLIQFYTERFKSLQDSSLCSNSSPIYNIQYGLKNVQEVRGVFYCDQYSKRTCCSEQNFNEIKLKWFREYQQSQGLSGRCQESFQKLACYDCDGDIGQRLRSGICPRFCTQIYNDCKYDMFQFDDKNQKLRFCRKNDVLCSELRFISNDTSLICKSLGFSVNNYNDMEEWFENIIVNSTLQQAACWDGTPSDKIFGRAITPLSEYSKGEYISKSLNYMKMITYVCIGLMVTVMGLLIFYTIMTKKF